MKKIKIGQIIKTRGIKGEVKVASFTSFNQSRFAVGNNLLVEINDQFQQLQIVSYKIIKNAHYLSFKNYQDINLVSVLIGAFLYIDEKQRQQLAPDQYYYNDLIGFKVADFVVSAVEELPGNHALRVKKDNISRLILMRKVYIDKIDIANKTIILTKLGAALLD